MFALQLAHRQHRCHASAQVAVYITELEHVPHTSVGPHQSVHHISFTRSIRMSTVGLRERPCQRQDGAITGCPTPRPSLPWTGAASVGVSGDCLLAHASALQRKLAGAAASGHRCSCPLARRQRAPTPRRKAPARPQHLHQRYLWGPGLGAAAPRHAVRARTGRPKLRPALSPAGATRRWAFRSRQQRDPAAAAAGGPPAAPGVLTPRRAAPAAPQPARPRGTPARARPHSATRRAAARRPLCSPPGRRPAQSARPCTHPSRRG